MQDDEQSFFKNFQSSAKFSKNFLGLGHSLCARDFTETGIGFQFFSDSWFPKTRVGTSAIKNLKNRGSNLASRKLKPIPTSVKSNALAVQEPPVAWCPSS